MKPSTRALLFAIVSLMVVVGRAIAQDDPNDDNPQDHTCDKAAKILAKGHPAKKELWALGVMVKCAGGAAALAGAWSPVPTDSTELFVLADASRDVADVRVLNAALAAVQNASVPQTTRHIAIDVVLAQYGPMISLGAQNWTDDTGRWTLAMSQDYYQVTGEQPVTAADRQRIVAAFRTLSTTDPDPKIRRVAALVAQELSAVCDGRPCLPPPAGSGLD
jgi:hypothetical protein